MADVVRVRVHTHILMYVHTVSLPWALAHVAGLTFKLYLELSEMNSN